jgi:phage shock protein C
MRKIRRSKSKRMIAGICGGLADYLNVDVTVIRLVYVIVSVMSGAFPGLLIYILAMFIIPSED